MKQELLFTEARSESSAVVVIHERISAGERSKIASGDGHSPAFAGARDVAIRPFGF